VFLARDKKNGRFRDRRGETLFIDARHLGIMVDRVHAELTDQEIALISQIYHSWRGDRGSPEYTDIPGLAKSATQADIRSHKYVLFPGRYAGFSTRPSEKIDYEQMNSEITELLTRFLGFEAASSSALAVLRELLNG
jgi:type I restriction enzyme M protein